MQIIIRNSSCDQYQILNINNNQYRERSVMDSPRQLDRPGSQCRVGVTGAERICISQDCTLANPYVCGTCEEAHEHNGTILAVRVSKVKEIYNKIKHRKEENDHVVSKLQELRENINSKIDSLIQSRVDSNNEISQINLQLDQFMQHSLFQPFAATWNKLKHNSHLLQQKKQKSSKTIIEQFKQQLKLMMEPATNKTEEDPKKLQIDARLNSHTDQTKQNEFTDHFANIFCYLPFELKLKPKQNIIKQIEQLSPTSKPQLKILSKLCQLSGQEQRALELYNSLLKQNNLDVEIINRKALLLKKMKRLNEAYDQFTVLIGLLKDKINPEFYYFHRGEICAEMGKFNEALNEYQKCVGKQALKTHNLDKSMGAMFQKQGKIAQAIKSYKKSLEHEHTSAESKKQINQSLYECAKAINNNELALECLNTMFKDNPENIDILLKRAKVYHELKQHQNSINDYTVLIGKYSNNPGIFYNRAVEYIYSGMSEQSIPDLKKAIQLNPQFKEAVHLLASTCFELMQKHQTPQVATRLKELAINSYEYSLNFFKNNEGIFHNLGVLLADNNPERAYECFKCAIELNPKLTASYVGKVKTAILLRKDPNQTMHDLKVLIGLGDRSVSTFLMKSVLEEELGLIEQALATAELVLKADPQNQTANKLKNRLAASIEKAKQHGKQQQAIMKQNKEPENQQKTQQNQWQKQQKEAENSSKQQKNSEQKGIALSLQGDEANK